MLSLTNFLFFLASIFLILIIRKNIFDKKIIYYGIGIGFISFFISSIAILMKNISFFSPNIIFSVFLCLNIFLIIYSIFKGNVIKKKNLRITSNKIKNNLKFIFLSDFHLGSNSQEYLEKVISILNKIQYDFLLIGGDLIDSSSFKLKYLRKFKLLKKKIFFVTGNHEYYLNNTHEILEALKRNGVLYLNNSALIYKNLNIIGLNDNQNVSSQKNLVLKLKKEHLFNLVLVHKPLVWSFIRNKVDLVLSGHTHNGQIFPFNFLVKLKFKFCYGIYKKYESTLYVSSGLGCWGPKMRLGSNNEILEINLLPK
tara:strand:+ start:545 stop:1477 length:933 start_codon:yes stop_codon:yes gene_type:complete